MIKYRLSIDTNKQHCLTVNYKYSFIFFYRPFDSSSQYE